MKYYVAKDFYFKYILFFWFSVHQRILKKKLSPFPQTNEAAQLFSALIIINVFEQQISILKSFLKDRVTL